MSKLKVSLSRTYPVVLLALTGLLLVGCYTRTGPYKVEVFTEMHYNQSYRSQEGPRLLSAEGSVPISGVGVKYSPEEAKELSNPLPKSNQVLAEGSELYRVNCAMCHGVTGKGDGPVGEFLTKWKYGRPPNLTAATTQNRTDGDIFSIISFTLFGRSGISPMPEFSKLLTQDERWALVHYLRTLRK